MTTPSVLSNLITNCSIKYVEWKNSYEVGDEYRYKVTVAMNPIVWGTGNRFNLFTSQPNSDPGENYELVAVINGNIWGNDGSTSYPMGFTKVANEGVGNSGILQYLAPDSLYEDILCIGSTKSSGGSTLEASLYQNMASSQENIIANYLSAMNGDLTETGGGYCAAGAYTSAIHSFIGYNNDTNTAFMGWNTTAMRGSALITSVKNIFGTNSRVVVLDGGGSTQMLLRGEIARSSSDSGGVRTVENAICIYQKRMVSEKVTISTSTSPSLAGTVTGSGQYDVGSSVTLTANPASGYSFKQWSDGVKTNPYTFTAATNFSITAQFEETAQESVDNSDEAQNKGSAYILENGALKPYVFTSRPDEIYIKNGTQLVSLIKKYNIEYEENGGNDVEDSDYYHGETVTLSSATHENKDSIPVSFSGWYRSNDFSTKYDKIGSLASGDRKYYAKWTQSKKQYRGYYSSVETQSLSDSGYHSSLPERIFLCDANTVTYSTDVTIKHVFINVDTCDSSWNNYRKPSTYYGYYTTPGDYTTFVEVGKGSDIDTVVDLDVNFTLPAGCAIGFKSVRINDGVSRNHLYVVDCYYKYESASAYTNWQDSSTPPSGSWAAGSPEERLVSRYYTGTTWTSWE